VEKKGQGATEYLILFAVGVIMVLIVLGVLGPFGNYSQEASELYWRDADIALLSYSLSSSTDSFVFTLGNNLDTSIQIQSVSIGNFSSENLSFPLLPGSRMEMSVAQDCAQEGDTFDLGPVLIRYTDLSTEVTQSFLGTVNLVGRCTA